MLIKEYRIPMPLSVDEYRIAQLYMIQKKSREESSGSDSRVEILFNRPYSDGPGGCGQYTKKIYHIGSHLPSWLRGILPKTALQVEEEAWNAYPYCRTKFTCPFMEKFSVDVETIYASDLGHQGNVFKLLGAEARREVDFMDIVKDHCSDYMEAEDPKLFKSAETGRGPLDAHWLQDTDQSTHSVMCAYKVCRVDFRYWGMQTRVERFIHDTALRKTMLRAHRQAWVWQDEWCHLNIDDIRRLEKETEIALRTVAGGPGVAMDNDADAGVNPTDSTQVNDQVAGENSLESRQVMSPGLSVMSPEELGMSGYSPAGGSRSSFSGSVSSGARASLDVPSLQPLLPAIGGSGASSHSLAGDMSPSHSIRSKASAKERFRSSLKRHRSAMVDNMEAERIVSNAFLALAGSDTESEDEFYDAKENVSGEEDDELDSVPVHSQNTRLSVEKKRRMLGSPTSDVYLERMAAQAGDSFDSDDLLDIGDGSSDDESFSSAKPDQPGLDDVVRGATQVSAVPGGNRRISEVAHASVPPVFVRPPMSPETHLPAGHAVKVEHVSPASSLSSGDSNPSRVTHLILVLHGGQPLDADADAATPQFNVNLFQSKLESVAETHYASLSGHVAVRHVACPLFSRQALNMLDLIDTTTHHRKPLPSGQRLGSTAIFGNSRLGMIPMLSVSQHNYQDYVQATITSANNVYMEYLQSDDGRQFTGEVCVVADCMGAILAYDAMQLSGQYQEHSCQHSHAGSPMQGTPRPRSRRQSSDGPTMTPLNSSSGSAMSPLNSSSGQLGLLFQVSHFFALGSPLGLVLGQRRLQKATGTTADGRLLPDFQGVGNFYNIVYETCPFSCRIEPLLSSVFSSVALHAIAQYRHYPYGDGCDTSLSSCLNSHPHLQLDASASDGDVWSGVEAWSTGATTTTTTTTTTSTSSQQPVRVRSARRGSGRSIGSRDSQVDPKYVAGQWWGDRRIDYLLYAPDAVELLPDSALAPILHSSFWESLDLAAFIIRQLMPHTNGGDSTVVGRDNTLFVPDQPREKWLSKATALKLRSVSANHRATDCAVSPNTAATVSGKFMYGSLDIATLSNEKVDLYMMMEPPGGKWQLLKTELTDKTGRATFTFTPDHDLGPDLYPLRMVVRGDHTQAECHLALLPAHTQVVVFSVDGSFAASLSIMGTDPRVHAGAVDVVRFWQELNYLVVYVTARPSMQKKRVVSWLAQHNFPHGLIFFSEGWSTDPQGQKAAFLHKLVNEMNVKIHRAYGSSKDKHLYKALGLQPHEIYVVGKPSQIKLRSSKKKTAEYISDGYATHLDDLTRQPLVPANTAVTLRKQSFGLPSSARKRHRFGAAYDHLGPVSVAAAAAAAALPRTSLTLNNDNVPKSPGKRKSFFRTALSRRPSSKVSDTDILAQQRSAASSSLLPLTRDRSNSDPSSLAAIKAAAAAAAARPRKLTPPVMQDSLLGSQVARLLAPRETQRCYSVPEGVNVHAEKDFDFTDLHLAAPVSSATSATSASGTSASGTSASSDSDLKVGRRTAGHGRPVPRSRVTDL